MRYTAPSIRFTNRQGVTLEAGGFQSFEAYDVLIANLDQSLTRRAPATDAAEVLNAFPDGLTTAEVALIMTEDKYTPDLNKAEDSLIAAIDAEAATRLPLRARRAVGPERADRARRGLEKAGRRRSGAPLTPLRCRRRQREGQRLAVRARTERVAGLDRLLERDVDHVVGDGAAVRLQRSPASTA